MMLACFASCLANGSHSNLIEKPFPRCVSKMTKAKKKKKKTKKMKKTRKKKTRKKKTRKKNAYTISLSNGLVVHQRSVCLSVS